MTRVVVSVDLRDKLPSLSEPLEFRDEGRATSRSIHARLAREPAAPRGRAAPARTGDGLLDRGSPGAPGETLNWSAPFRGLPAKRLRPAVYGG